MDSKETNEQILILLKDLANQQKNIENKTSQVSVKDWSVIFGILLVIGGWIWYFATDHSLVLNLQKEQEKIKAKTLTIISIEKDLQYIMRDIEEIKRSVSN